MGSQPLSKYIKIENKKTVKARKVPTQTTRALRDTANSSTNHQVIKKAELKVADLTTIQESRVPLTEMVLNQVAPVQQH